MTPKPDIDFTPEDLVTVMGGVIGFWDEHIELIKNNYPALKLFIEIFEETEDVLMPPEGDGSLQDENVEAFREEFIEKVVTSFENDKSLPKRQLFGFIIDIYKEEFPDTDHSPEEKKLNKVIIAAYEMMLNTIDPWVNYENKKYRFSRFLMLKRKECHLVRMPETGEYLAMDKEKLENGFSKMGKAKDLAGGVDDDKIIVEEEEAPPHLVELDPVAQAKSDKKKEANRKTRERKKAAKKAKKDQKAMDEKEEFKLEVVNEEGSSTAAATTAT